MLTTKQAARCSQPLPVFLPFQHENLSVQWPPICQDPQLLQKARRSFLEWLPGNTRQALLDELRRTTEERTRPCSGAAQSSQRSKHPTTIGKKTAPLLQASNEEKRNKAVTKCGVKGVSIAVVTHNLSDPEGYADSEAALAFLFFLLYPALEHQSMGEASGEARAVPSPNQVLIQLELTCAVLLRCVARAIHTDDAVRAIGSSCGPADASLSARVQAQAVSASLQLWLRFFLFFFLDQLRRERIRVASLVVTAARLKQTVSLLHPRSTKEDKGSTGVKPMSTTSTNQPVTEEEAYLQTHPFLNGGHPLHFYAQKLHNATRNICRDAKRARVFDGDLAKGNSRSRKPILLAKKKHLQPPQRKQTTAASSTRRQSRPPGKRACGWHGRQQRWRADRETSSDSISSSAFSSDSECTGKEDDEDSPVVKRVTPSSCAKSATLDDDVPLAALAPFLSCSY
ncbi:hypothetical protein ABB37_01430 [Leptomonas pyrrhocoris]|uniref:Uncharacterized protein n=1 Tax=Leptomonas pyrrhocoris TaxID=157538 RepID=A0A0M9G8R0_LEPPY|nr:hypothetical protein ABB37_01430 [Leptomonas pyrrhocoris]KPA84997.1 hypothetical protein ABB37_01430 [Leptomonas pyrrhocoris]|eukprot:XP_015663436.1 hypothetical protein ABB37_01430 [Leptomonas pyrrhocoris]